MRKVIIAFAAIAAFAAFNVSASTPGLNDGSEEVSGNDSYAVDTSRWMSLDLYAQWGCNPGNEITIFNTVGATTSKNIYLDGSIALVSEYLGKDTSTANIGSTGMNSNYSNTDTPFTDTTLTEVPLSVAYWLFGIGIIGFVKLSRRSI